MANISAADIVGALQVLIQSTLTAQQIADMLSEQDITEADVLAQLDKTDATIDQLIAED